MLNISAAKVVLTLPPHVRQHCFNIHKDLMGEHWYRHAPQGYVPHITLAYGVLDFSHLLRIQKLMRILAYRSRALNICIHGLSQGSFGGREETHSFLDIQMSKKLWELHRMAMKEMSRYWYQEDVTHAMVYDTVAADSHTLSHVQNYIHDHAYKQWKSRIRLGEGVSDYHQKKQEITLTDLSLWKAGIYGRLTKKIYGTRLGTRR